MTKSVFTKEYKFMLEQLVKARKKPVCHKGSCPKNSICLLPLLENMNLANAAWILLKFCK